ncbi:zinc ribbon domain-containing protein [uncultured Sphaerochaeta sp.]|uniref:FmdB family zinc ribbon protein n=1 Tax=uncultured Sphaerochaeta sp. TaxID=886478 RepID=UPI002A0A2AA2|nr:zinc ribbon domain-containing protein [uncultured Sphaerochaeta sp.]
MPIYEYECEMCHAHVELHQSVSEHTAPAVCPSCNCEHTMKRIFTPSAVIFKGNGYYSTDNPVAKNSNSDSHKE